MTVAETSLGPMADAKPSITKLFVDRLTREGRLEEWKETLATVQAETGQRYGQARWAAMKRCGYQGADHEHQLNTQWLAKEHAKTVIAAEQKDESNETFESALANLPLKADRQIENDWIMGHVALTRRARGADKAAPVKITANDILAAAHGAAPSRAAAIRLQLFVDDPDELSKALTTPMKKGDGAEGSRDDFADDMGLEEVERLLSQVRNQCHEDEITEAITLLTADGYTVTKVGQQPILPV